MLLSITEIKAKDTSTRDYPHPSFECVFFFFVSLQCVSIDEVMTPKSYNESNHAFINAFRSAVGPKSYVVTVQPLIRMQYAPLVLVGNRCVRYTSISSCL